MRAFRLAIPAGAVIVFAVLGASAAQQRPTPGNMLMDGAKLHYASNGATIPPWPVSGVQHGVSGRAGAACSRLVMQRAPIPSAGDSAFLCVAGDTLLIWDAARAAWAPTRPVAPRMTLTLPTRTGGRSRYETDVTGTDTISGETITVVLTTMTTLDSTGKVIRRLRERYSLGLATATRGEFAVPDSSAPGGWRVQQLFELRRIERP